MDMGNVGILAPVIGAMGLVWALITYIGVVKKPVGNDTMKAIGDEIHLGAMTFLKAQYSKVAIFVVVVGGLILWQLGVENLIAFLVGAFSSALAGGHF